MRQDADDDSVAKLIHILKMLDSQVILDYSNSGLQGDVHMERNIKKPEGRNRPRRVLPSQEPLSLIGRHLT